MSSYGRTLVRGVTAGCLVFALGPAQGAGFGIIEQSVTGLGNAYAGGAASAEDASTVFFNPAGMTLLNGTQFVGGFHIISPTTEFEGDATTALGLPVAGGDGGEAGETGVVPNLYYLRDMGPNTKFGLGINAPFGLATDYDDDWVGRYHALRSEVRSLNINPALAWKVGDRLSLGAGVNLQYLEVPELSQALNFGTICFASGACAPNAADGRVELEGDDWSWGFNLGLLYEINDATRLGMAYRSKVDHELDGSADFSNAPPALAGVYADSGVTADITMPESLSLSVYHDLSKRWAVMGDVSWTRWSRFDELRVQYDDGRPDDVTEEGWDDSMRYSIGLSYRPNNAWTMRTGIAYDETPIPSAELRTPRIPGNDRRWLSVGASYRQSERLWFDVGYTRLLVSDTRINNTSATGDVLTGTYESSVDILSGQMRWTFD